LKKSNGIICPDFITPGYYTVNDILLYFGEMKKKWNEKFEEDQKDIIKNRVNTALKKIDEAFNERQRRLINNILKASNEIAQSKSANYIIIRK